MMTKLVEMEDSQYSYKNTLVAMSTDGSILVGILVAYDGADVKRYVSALLKSCNRGFWNGLFGYGA